MAKEMFSPLRIREVLLLIHLSIKTFTIFASLDGTSVKCFHASLLRWRLLAGHQHPLPPSSLVRKMDPAAQWQPLQLLGVVMHLILVSSKADTQIKSFTWQFIWECDLRRQEWRTSETGAEGCVCELTTAMQDCARSRSLLTSLMNAFQSCVLERWKRRIYPLSSIPYWLKP